MLGLSLKYTKHTRIKLKLIPTGRVHKKWLSIVCFCSENKEQLVLPRNNVLAFRLEHISRVLLGNWRYSSDSFLVRWIRVLNVWMDGSAQSPCSGMLSTLEIGLIWVSIIWQDSLVHLEITQGKKQDYVALLEEIQAGWITRAQCSPSATGLPELRWMVCRQSFCWELFFAPPTTLIMEVGRRPASPHNTGWYTCEGLWRPLRGHWNTPPVDITSLTEVKFIKLCWIMSQTSLLQ